jgi:hypothetical protein
MHVSTTSLVPPVLALIGWLDLPPEVSRVADNYTHLHEQPTPLLRVCDRVGGSVAAVAAHRVVADLMRR